MMTDEYFCGLWEYTLSTVLRLAIICLVEVLLRSSEVLSSLSVVVVPVRHTIYNFLCRYYSLLRLYVFGSSK